MRATKMVQPAVSELCRWYLVPPPIGDAVYSSAEEIAVRIVGNKQYEAPTSRMTLSSSATRFWRRHFSS